MTASIEVRELLDNEGGSYFARWFNQLDARAATKITDALNRMEQGNLGDVKSVGGGVLERRLAFGPGYRIYFGRDGNTLVVLLGGGTKRRQARDIGVAQSLWNEYRAERRKRR